MRETCGDQSISGTLAALARGHSGPIGLLWRSNPSAIVSGLVGGLFVLLNHRYPAAHAPDTPHTVRIMIRRNDALFSIWETGFNEVQWFNEVTGLRTELWGPAKTAKRGQLKRFLRQIETTDPVPDIRAGPRGPRGPGSPCICPQCSPPLRCLEATLT